MAAQPAVGGPQWRTFSARSLVPRWNMPLCQAAGGAPTPGQSSSPQSGSSPRSTLPGDTLPGLDQKSCPLQLFPGTGPALLCLGTGLDKPESVADEQGSKCVHGEAPPGPGRHRALTAVSRAVRSWSQAGVRCSPQGQIGARGD